MPELGLIDALSSELRELFKGYMLLNKAGVLQEVRVFKQYMPQAEGLAIGAEKKGIAAYGVSDYEENFPCIVLKYTEHTDKEENRLDQSITSIKLLYGVYDEKAECEGWRDILNMIEKTRDYLLVNRIVARKYLLNMPIKTRLVEGDTWPVYFGEMDMAFTTGRPVMGKDFVTKGAVREWH